MNLAQAVAANDLATVKELLQSGQDSNQTFPCSPRQSNYAVQPLAGHAHNFEPDDVLYGATPLNLAVLNGNEDIVRALLATGADVNKKDGRGRTPLLCAVYGLDTLTITPANLAMISQTLPAHLSILRNCILPHPSITLSTLNAPQDEIKGITPLCLASYLGKEVVVRCLLEGGKVDVDATDRKGATALMYAARDRHMSVVKTLLRYGASPDQTDSNGWSSIQYGQMYPEIVQMFEEALRCKRPEVLHLLTPPESPEPSPSLPPERNSKNKAPLPPSLSQSLVRYPLYYSKLSSLLSSLPSFNSDNNGNGPGSLSMQSHIKSSADAVQAQQMQKTTHLALLEAIRLGDHLSLQSLLMAPPARADAQNGPSSVALVNHHDPQTGLTPLHHALRTRPLPSLETVKILYQAGADMNAQSHYGRTALHHLCRFSLEHALTPVLTPEEIQAQQAAAAAASAAAVATTTHTQPNAGAPRSPDEARPRRRPRDRTETAGSTNSNHLTPLTKETMNTITSSAASTTSSNDLSTGMVRGAFLQLPDTHASPEEIKRISNHLAKCCKLLLRLGSLVNNADRHGNTPLHFAVEYGGVLEVVQVLVDEGADIDQRNTKGLKPLDVVRGEQSEEMRKILESGRKNAAGPNGEESQADGSSAGSYPPTRDSILKPLNLPETLHEVDFQFNQVLQNLEHYQNHTSVSIESSLQYITDQILLGWSPDNPGANGEFGQSQEEYNAGLVASLESLKYELETTYELLTITEDQYRDVVTFYEAELDDMTKQNLTVLTSYDSEKTKVAGLFAVYTRLIEQLEELEAENEGLKKELEEKKRRGLASLGRLVHGAMGGQWSGVRNGTQISLPPSGSGQHHSRSSLPPLNTTPKVEALDEEQLSGDNSSTIDGLPRPAMVLVSQEALSQHPAGSDILMSPTKSVAGTVRSDKDGQGAGIVRPSSPTLTILSSDQEPTLHTIAVLSQKVSLLEQELSSKTYDIKERDLLVGELTDLIEEQTRAFDNEIKNREERIDSLMTLLGRAESGEQVQTLVDELSVKIQEEETVKAEQQQQEQQEQATTQPSSVPPSLATSANTVAAAVPGSTTGENDWSFLLKASSQKAKDAQANSDEPVNEAEIVAKLKHELELSRAQTARLEMANASLKERWQTAMQELNEIRLSEAAHPDGGRSMNDNTPSPTSSTRRLSEDMGAMDDALSIYAFSERNHSLMDRAMTTVWVPKRPNDIQDEPLVLLIGEDGSVQPDLPSLQEIELTFEILMANLAEISRDIEDAELRVKECSKAKVLIYQRLLHLDEMQKSLDESVDKIVSQPVKATDQSPQFMEDQLKLQSQVDRLMTQAEEATELYTKLKDDLSGFKREKQAKLKELDSVRDLMRKIGPQELLRGLLAKLESAQSADDSKATARRAAIQVAVQQGMELAAEMAQEEAAAAASSESRDRVASHLWRNSCSVVDEGDVQDAINCRLSTASIDYYTQSCSISDHKLFIQSLCSTLYALQMTTTHQITSLKTSLAESKASLVLADQELSNLNDQIAGLYDEVGTLRSMLRGLQQELDRLIQHRKAEVEKVWEIVGEVKITTGGTVNRLGGGSGGDDDDEGSVSSTETVTKDLMRKTSIQSRIRETSSYLSLSNNALGGAEPGAEDGLNEDGSVADGLRLNRSLSISRAERASVLRRISSPPQVAENDEEGSTTHHHHHGGSPGGASGDGTHGHGSPSTTGSRVSHEFSDMGSELDRHALISAEMEKLRSVHLHLLSTITEYKRRISVVKDRNLKLVATLLDRERVRLWTADGQDEIISAIVGHGATSGPASHSANAVAAATQAAAAAAAAASAAATAAAAMEGASNAVGGGSGAGSSTTGSSSSTLNPGLAPGSKKTHHMGLTAAEDGIKLLRCQLERIRQCEMARFTDMGAGLMGIVGPGAGFVGAGGSNTISAGSSGGNIFSMFSAESSVGAPGSALRARTMMQQRSTRVTFSSNNNVNNTPGAKGGVVLGAGNTSAGGDHTSSSSSSASAGGQTDDRTNGGDESLTPTSTTRHAFSKFEATMYSDLENRYGKGF
ncbi:hypothetical protein DFQ26_004298 [Actinomortierella ambigua]|nr:hypothetical protein DFQ26_004298 [Actinomortierella ambigua]